MSAIFATAAQRRRTCLLASNFLVPVACFAVSAAEAQQVAAVLPPIEISSPDENRTRAKPKTEQEQGSRRVACQEENRACIKRP